MTLETLMTFLLSFVAGFIFYSQQVVANATALSLGRRRGVGAALAVLAGALAGDALWTAGALMIVALSLQVEPLRVIFGVVGSFFFLRLAWAALLDARQGAMPRNDMSDAQGGWRTGAQITFRNPYALGFWVGVAALICLLTAPQPTPPDFVLLFAGIVIGAGLWSLLLAQVSQAAPSAAFFRAVNLVGGVIAALIGVYGLWFVVTQALAR